MWRGSSAIPGAARQAGNCRHLPCPWQSAFALCGHRVHRPGCPSGRSPPRRCRTGLHPHVGIHPAQIRPISAAFAPTQTEIDAARITLAAAAADWHISVDGVLHDRASYRYYWQLERARRPPPATGVQHWFYDVDSCSLSSLPVMKSFSPALLLLIPALVWSAPNQPWRGKPAAPGLCEGHLQVQQVCCQSTPKNHGGQGRTQGIFACCRGLQARLELPLLRWPLCRRLGRLAPEQMAIAGWCIPARWRARLGASVQVTQTAAHPGIST